MGHIRNVIVIVFGHIDLLTVVHARASGETAVPLHIILELDWKAGHRHCLWLLLFVVLAFDLTVYFIHAYTFLSPLSKLGGLCPMRLSMVKFAINCGAIWPFAVEMST